jgi:sugar transferase (PEP-CTERM system associated)
MSAWAINGRIRTPILVIGVVEFLIVGSSLYFAGMITYGSVAASEAEIGPIWPQAILAGTVILLSLIAVGLYQFNLRAHYYQAATRIMVGLIGGCVLLALICSALPLIHVPPNAATIAIVYSVCLLLLVRFVFVRALDGNLFRHRSLIYGAGRSAGAISQLRRRADRRGFQVVAQVAAAGEPAVASSEIPESADSSITDLALTWHADEIVVALDDRRGNLPVRDLLDARLAGIDVLDLSEFLERETGKIRVDLLKPGWLVFSPGFRTGRFRSFAKRVLDVLASLSLIVLTTPLILVVAIAIKLEDGLAAPLLYLQTRVGRGGRPFRVMKFRSMSADAEADGKARWATVNDKRVTAIGRIMRQYRIDEIPQLFNILRGEMSLVGPRPERPEFVEELQQTIPFYSVRHTVKPGLTGWAQLKYTYGATEEDALEKLQYELYYLKNHSLVLDLLIILQTVEVVLWGKGAR